MAVNQSPDTSTDTLLSGASPLPHWIGAGLSDGGETLVQVINDHPWLPGILRGGVTRSLGLDAHGKCLGSALLDLDLDLPTPN